MEVVNLFNKELKSILECKLPVSRHKMSLITKSAMKALKFYKHVVQSVEKFIIKCRCEYKVPGLYVIDAIVRQSKHQNCDKDVFVPRFMRNIVTTFIHLSQCHPKDVTSIERVLRLWQQNGVFPTDLVEALLEIVYDASDNNKILHACNIVVKLVNDWNILKGKPVEKIDVFMPHMDCVIPNDAASKTEETGDIVPIEINQIQVLHQKIVEQSALLAQGEMIDSDTLAQLHQSMEELTKKAAQAASIQQSKLEMLTSDEKDHMTEVNSDLEYVEQLQQMVDTLSQTRALQEELKHALELKQNPIGEMPKEIIEETKEDQELEEGEDPSTTEDNVEVDMRVTEMCVSLTESYHNHSDQGSVNNLSSDKLSRTSSGGSRKRKCSIPNNEPPRQKKLKSKEQKLKEKKNPATRKRWMPLLRAHFVGIVSHTIFIGHLHKHVSESKLRAICEEFGSIAEFNMIPPRGCAFVAFDRRKGAYKAVAKMNEMKFEGRDLKVAWAPNKGVKDDKIFREFWVESEGCTYIPIGQFPNNRSKELSDGFADLDEDSLTEELKQAIYQFEQQKTEAVARSLEPPPPAVVETVLKTMPVETNTSYFNHFSVPPPMLPPPIISFPPPPPPPPPPPSHLFMIPPIISVQLRPDLLGSITNYMNHRGIISTADTGQMSAPVSLNTVTYSSITVSPHVNNRNHRARHNSSSFFQQPSFRNPSVARSRNRFERHQVMFTRPPPLGCPVLRSPTVSRPSGPRP